MCIGKVKENVLITVISPVLSVISALLGVFLTQYFNFRNESRKEEKERKQEIVRVKREKLDSIYKQLIKIVNQFPSKTPVDILRNFEYPPNYHLENFDVVYDILDSQIRDYEKRLTNKTLDYEVKTEFEIEISNRRYWQREITEIRDSYFNAKQQYEQFCDKEKLDFELYAGQDVKNLLVQFNITWHNAFIAGRPLQKDQSGSLLDEVRWQLIEGIRRDIEIH